MCLAIWQHMLGKKKARLMMIKIDKGIYVGEIEFYSETEGFAKFSDFGTDLNLNFYKIENENRWELDVYVPGEDDPIPFFADDTYKQYILEFLLAN
jgi:hypothetical protein